MERGPLGSDCALAYQQQTTVDDDYIDGEWWAELPEVGPASG